MKSSETCHLYHLKPNTEEKREKTIQKIIVSKVKELQIEKDGMTIDFEIPQYLRKFQHSLLQWHKILHFPPVKIIVTIKKT